MITLQKSVGKKTVNCGHLQHLKLNEAKIMIRDLIHDCLNNNNNNGNKEFC